ncbi:RhoGAP domain-containing protein [Heterostelium album PN500]|uniref:RhoGAP domain-containing protein n=1 Tax=Heterostelium pallidum (strain ATCC 26659 / Pp 5 / PN500) TaxID=670386 RepID=D3BF33_HETP5|nr:RhoGAP domain-containing protein [Heterostelium album PN500]EFA80514.1 RhoGAP domain-containing protein [Heterostelium album PN500]|eukprot:XP_020432634.1 RhoGAP domain-containing protein [Heterostelium album PN500]
MALRKKRLLPHQRRKKQNIRDNHQSLIENQQLQAKMRLKKKQQQKIQQQQQQKEDDEIGMFGVELSKLMELQGEDSGDVPMLLTVVLDKIVELEGLETEGIFRINGNMREVDAIASEGFDPDDEDSQRYSVHTWASLLKKWIRELPTPLIPRQLYKRFTECESPLEMKLLLDEVECPTTLAVIDTLGMFFGRLLQPDSVAKTKMDIDNIAKVLTPTLFPLATGNNSKLDLLSVMNQQKNETNAITLLLMYYKEKQSEEQQLQQQQQQQHQQELESQLHIPVSSIQLDQQSNKQDDLFVNNYEQTTTAIDSI